MKAKNPSAVALGRLGGKASAAALTPEERSQKASRAGKRGGRPSLPRCERCNAKIRPGVRHVCS